MQELPRVVPLVQGLARVDSLVALQSDQVRPEDGGERLGRLRLSDSGFTLEQQRTVHLEREVHPDRQAVIAQVVRFSETRGQLLR